MADGATHITANSPEELAHIKATNHELQIRQYTLRAVARGPQGQIASGLLLLPDWLDGHMLVSALRGVVRELGSQATEYEEFLRAKEGGNGSMPAAQESIPRGIIR